MKAMQTVKRLCVFLLLSCLLVSCAKTTEYPQFTLTMPDSILITKGDQSVRYDKTSSEFMTIYSQIQEVWWKKDLNYEMVTNGNPVKVLRQITEDDINNQTVLVSFLYDNPISWVDAFEPDHVKTYAVSRYVFFPFGDKNHEVADIGSMAVVEDDKLYSQNNVYVFLYSQGFRDTIDKFLNA